MRMRGASRCTPLAPSGTCFRRSSPSLCADIAERLMSTPSETDLDLDSLFLPAWAQQPANKNLYAKYEGHEEREPRRDDRGGRPNRPRGDRPPGRPEGH